MRRAWSPLVRAQLKLLLLLGLLDLGLSLGFYFFPPDWAWVQRIEPRIPAERWWCVFAIYIGWMIFAQILISKASECQLRLFNLRQDLDAFRSNPGEAWLPPTLVGLLESVVYPTAFLINQSEFIAVWLALKVAGQWGGWTSQEPKARIRFQRFLINSTLSLLFGAAAFLSLKAWVLYPAVVGGA